jgi:cytochrome c peroxidase
MAESTQCSMCHTPATGYTDRTSTPLRQLPPPQGYDEDPNPAFKVPSLLYVDGTPPYFHDGRAATLEDVVNLNNDRMGKTNHLSRDDRAALIAFLRIL